MKTAHFWEDQILQGVYRSEKLAEILNRLPQPFKNEALAEIYDPETLITYGERTTEGLIQAKALYFGFTWGETPQGYGYWEKLHNELSTLGREQQSHKYRHG